MNGLFSVFSACSEHLSWGMLGYLKTARSVLWLVLKVYTSRLSFSLITMITTSPRARESCDKRWHKLRSYSVGGALYLCQLLELIKRVENKEQGFWLELGTKPASRPPWHSFWQRIGDVEHSSRRGTYWSLPGEYESALGEPSVLFACLAGFHSLGDRVGQGVNPVLLPTDQRMKDCYIVDEQTVQ